MAIEPIEKLTRPLSRKEEKKVASHDAPEDYLKRAVEQFIIEFPEFEDLQGEELYKEMEKKGYFSDRWASSDYSIPITPGYMRDALLGGYGDHIHGLSDDQLRGMEDDEIKEIYDEINEMFKYGKIDELKKEVQVASDPDPMDEKWGMYQDMIKDGRYEGTWEDFLLDFEDAVDIPYAAKGGIIGLRYG